MPSSGSNCCVVGCTNTQRKNKDVKFHSFPGRKYEEARKELWVQAIKRINLDGTVWKPTKNSKVCSKHFVGGIVSNIQGHPSYVPSIFPEIYKKRPSTQGQVRRYQRAAKRAQNRTSKNLKEPIIVDSQPPIQSVTMSSVSTQCYFGQEDSSFQFATSFDGNNVATSCNIPLKKLIIEKVDKACEVSSSYDICRGFDGSELFSQHPNLTHHLRIHTGEKPHHCSYCSKVFSSQSYLTKHLKIHGEMPHRCSYCSVPLARKSSLPYHIKCFYTVKQELFCYYCSTTFATKRSIIQHLRFTDSSKTFACINSLCE